MRNELMNAFTVVDAVVVDNVVVDNVVVTKQTPVLGVYCTRCIQEVQVRFLCFCVVIDTKCCPDPARRPLSPPGQLIL